MFMAIILASCGHKQSKSETKSQSALIDDRIIGQWMLWGSCDGSIMCNQCPEVVFKVDGFALSIYTNTIMKWDYSGTNVKITNAVSEYDIIQDGEYSVNFLNNDKLMELIHLKDSTCYKMNRMDLPNKIKL